MTLHTPGTEPAGTTEHSQVSSIIIREFEGERTSPTRTIRIPVKVFTVAASLVPHRVREELAKQGIDLDAIRQAASEISSPVTLVEVEEHEKQRRIVVSLE